MTGRGEWRAPSEVGGQPQSVGEGQGRRQQVTEEVWLGRRRRSRGGAGHAARLVVGAWRLLWGGGGGWGWGGWGRSAGWPGPRGSCFLIVFFTSSSPPSYFPLRFLNDISLGKI